MIRVWLNDGPAAGEHYRERYDPIIKVEVIDPVEIQWDPDAEPVDVRTPVRLMEYHAMYCFVGNAKRPARDAYGRIIYQEVRPCTSIPPGSKA
jgi:hypothetical protein